MELNAHVLSHGLQHSVPAFRLLWNLAEATSGDNAIETHRPGSLLLTSSARKGITQFSIPGVNLIIHIPLLIVLFLDRNPHSVVHMLILHSEYSGRWMRKSATPSDSIHFILISLNKSRPFFFSDVFVFHLFRFILQYHLSHHGIFSGNYTSTST
jgi:hypothetical protein